MKDAAGFYRAFDLVDVAVDDPPEDLAALDARQGSEAIPELEARGLTLYDVMAQSADVDDVAREWTSGFERTFDAADRLESRDGPVTDRAASVFLELLAERPDPFIVTQHDEATAERASERAEAALAGDLSPDELAEEFLQAEINPGTTADVVAAALFVALERGLSV